MLPFAPFLLFWWRPHVFILAALFCLATFLILLVVIANLLFVIPCSLLELFLFALLRLRAFCLFCFIALVLLVFVFSTLRELLLVRYVSLLLLAPLLAELFFRSMFGLLSYSLRLRLLD